MSLRRVTVAALVVAILGGCVAYVLAGRRPKDFLRWGDQDLVVTLAPGEQRTITTTLTALRRMPKTRLIVPDTLAPYVRITPDTLGRLKKNQTVPISIEVTAPLAPLTTTGTVEVGKPKRKGKVTRLPVPLSIRIEVVATSSTTTVSATTTTSTSLPPAGVFTVTIPRGFTATTHSYSFLGSPIYEIELTAEEDDEILIEARSVPAPPGLTSVVELGGPAGPIVIQERALVQAGDRTILRLLLDTPAGTVLRYYLLESRWLIEISVTFEPEKKAQAQTLAETVAGSVTLVVP